jgi:hypothetical protein
MSEIALNPPLPHEQQGGKSTCPFTLDCTQSGAELTPWPPRPGVSQKKKKILQKIIKIKILPLNFFNFLVLAPQIIFFQFAPSKQS